MAAELQPPGLGSPIMNSLPGTSVVAAQNVLSPAAENLGQTLAPKRHRRPSVRLGDIGDQPATIRTSKSWRLHPHLHREHNSNKSSSKIRPLTNLVTPTNGNFDYSSAETTTTNPNNGINSQRKFPKEFKSKRTTTTTSSKRVRTSFRIDQGEEEQPLDDDEERENGGNNHDFNEFDEDIDGDDNHNNGEEGFRDFDPEIDGPDQEQSPVHSADDVGVQLDTSMWHAHNRRSFRATRVSNSHHDLGLETNSRIRGIGLDDGVRKWLVELGLGRYAPVFEIHEVDDEVLPYLTLDDLKDMGINAVGSRRKLHSAIQKLRKGLS